MIPLRFLAPVLVALAVAGCASSNDPADDGVAPPLPPSPPPIIGASAPVETAAEQQVRGAAILARSDWAALSSLVVETSSPDLPGFEITPTCHGDRCTWAGKSFLEAGELRIDEYEFEPAAAAYFTKRGITVLRSQRDDFEEYGAWMEHAGFGVRSSRETSDDDEVWFETTYGSAMGEHTGRLPAVDATWRGNTIVGDAVVVFRITDYAPGSEVHLTFGGLYDVDLGEGLATPAITFGHIDLREDGTFEGIERGNWVSGAFYGPAHEEAAGIFEQFGVVGSFGAKRTAE